MAGEKLSNPQVDTSNANKWQNMDPNAHVQQDANKKLEDREKAKLEAEEKAKLEAAAKAKSGEENRGLSQITKQAHVIELIAEKSNKLNKANQTNTLDTLKRHAHVIDRCQKNLDQKKAEDLDAEKNPHGFELQLEQIVATNEEIGDEERKKCADYKAKLQRGTPNNDIEELAEYYARNRRLFRADGDSTAFSKAKAAYSNTLEKYLSLKSDIENFDCSEKANKILQQKHDELIAEMNAKMDEFIGDDAADADQDPDKDADKKDPNAAKDDKNQKNQDKTPKTPEEIAAEKERLTKEANKQLSDECERLRAEIDQKLVNNTIEELVARQAEIEDATIDHLDNGTLCRRIVNKVINNKAIKRVLVAGAVLGLAATGVGIVAGAAAGTVGFAGFSGVGAALGAVKGGISGAVMSRQNSKNSAVRGFTDESEIKQQIESMRQGDLLYDEKDVADWLLDQYESAKDTDRKSNIKRTAIASGLGAAAGAIVGGIEINTSINQDATDKLDGLESEKSGIEEQLSSASGNNTQVTASRLGEINIPEGHGAYDTFTQLGGDPVDFDKFQEIMHSLDAKYGMVPGSNGETAGLNGAVGQYAHTYPGPIDTWPEAARNYITEVANEAARQGLIPSSDIGTTINNTSNSVNIDDLNNQLADINTQIDNVKAILANRDNANPIIAGIDALTQWVAPISGGVVAGGIAGGIRGRDVTPDQSSAQTSTSQTPSQTPPQPSPQPANQPPVQQPQPQPAPTPNTTPNTPNQTSNTSENADEQYRNKVQQQLGDKINDTVLKLLTEKGYDLNNPKKYMDGWNSLSDEGKKAVVEFKRSEPVPHGDSGEAHGSGFRTWIRQNWVNIRNSSLPMENPFL